MSDELGYYTNGSRKALGAMNAKLRAKDPLYTTPHPSAGVVMPDGWKLVPVEPTLEMAEAVYFDGVDYTHGSDFDDFKKAWPLLLAVAPHPHTMSHGGKTVHDLLAVIHRDGGHYEHEHGTWKALADAMEVVNKERVEADYWRHAATSAPKADDPVKQMLLEAMQLMIDTYDEGGWPTASITIARAAIAAARQED